MIDVLKTLSALVKTRKSVPQQSKIPQKQPVLPQQRQEDKAAAVQPKQALPVTDQKHIETQLALAETRAKEIVLEAKDEAIRLRSQAEEEVRRKLEFIDRRERDLDSQEKAVTDKRKEAERKLTELEDIKAQQLKKLEAVSRMTKEEAKAEVLGQLKNKLREEVAREIREAQDEARETAELKAKDILVEAMRHGATAYVPEYTVSVVKIPDEDVKGRIIGKEGRNIRAFETATGVDVDLDEEGVIRLSCFDPVRREIARVVLERLLRDGRVQPGRIEDLVEQVKKELERIMFDEGQKLCHAVGVYNLPSPLVATLGRFKYRFSYGQNMIAHTLEETKIGIALAREVGADVNIVRLGCLLHDIGKVVMDKEGNHIELGVELLKKFGIPQKVVDCVAQHHEDTPFTSIESMLVYISDAISGSRPGARYENYDEYVKRLKDLEAIATSQKGVREAFAFQAGRELRVIVSPEQVDDATVTILARDIKQEIEDKLTYPGSVKVTVVRELRVTDVAK
jgi:ribonucrease Y